MIFFVLFLGFFYPFHNINYSYADEGIINQKKDKNSQFNIFLDFRNSIHSIVKKESFEGSRFYEDYLNLEIIGKANDKISYHFAKKLNDLNDIKNKTIVDLAYLKYKWNDKLYFLIGKQPYSFGSMEYYNKIYESPYQYINVYKNQENPIGLNFIYIPIKNHELQLQVVNSIKNLYYKEENKKEEKNPIGYSLNWNWSLFNHKIIQNRWSYSIFQENEHKKFWKLLALGSKVDLKYFSIEADYILSDEDIDRNGDITNILRSCHSDYKEIVPLKNGIYLIKLKYNFIPKWNLIAKGVYEMNTSKKGVNNILEGNKLFKKAYTYYGGIEFIPIRKNEDLSFYFLYKNQIINYNLDHPIKAENKNNHFITLGFSYRIKMI